MCHAENSQVQGETTDQDSKHTLETILVQQKHLCCTNKGTEEAE